MIFGTENLVRWISRTAGEIEEYNAHYSTEKKKKHSGIANDVVTILARDKQMVLTDGHTDEQIVVPNNVSTFMAVGLNSSLRWSIGTPSPFVNCVCVLLAGQYARHVDWSILSRDRLTSWRVRHAVRHNASTPSGEAQNGDVRNGTAYTSDDNTCSLLTFPLWCTGGGGLLDNHYIIIAGA